MRTREPVHWLGLCTAWFVCPARNQNNCMYQGYTLASRGYSTTKTTPGHTSLKWRQTEASFYPEHVCLPANGLQRSLKLGWHVKHIRCFIRKPKPLLGVPGEESTSQREAPIFTQMTTQHLSTAPKHAADSDLPHLFKIHAADHVQGDHLHAPHGQHQLAPYYTSFSLLHW